MKKARLIYAAVFCVLFALEVCIGLFAHDGFVRPYIGDVLVTILICCLCRTVVPNAVPALPIYVFAFAALVEVAQYFDIVKLLGLENHSFISTIVGRTFSSIDLLCYGVGCIIFWSIEKTVKLI